MAFICLARVCCFCNLDYGACMRALLAWFVLVAVTLVLTTVTFILTVVYDYRASRVKELAVIDDVLLTRAQGVPNAVSAEWQDRAELQQPYTDEEYAEICNRLALMISGFRGVGVGTAIELDGVQWVSAGVVALDDGSGIQPIPARTEIIETNRSGRGKLMPAIIFLFLNSIF